jgi:hypothetical protein
MEDLADPAEVSSRAGAASVLLFAESRDFPVRRFDGVPKRWLPQMGRSGPCSFSGEARPAEYYAFQIAVCAVQHDAGPLALRASDLRRDDGGSIPASGIGCINLAGIGSDGAPFTKAVNVPAGHVQPLWVGVQVPADTKGSYAGSIQVGWDEHSHEDVNLTLHVAGEALSDAGDSQPQHLSRLRWLNSTVGSEPTVTAPFESIRASGTRLAILGRSLDLSPSGLPAQITSFFNGSNTAIVQQGRQMLAAPLRLTINHEDSWKWQTADIATQPASASWSARGSSQNLKCDLHAQLGYDGAVCYRARISAEADTSVQDIGLEVLLHREVAKYVMGLGQRGGRSAGEGSALEVGCCQAAGCAVGRRRERGLAAAA